MTGVQTCALPICDGGSPTNAILFSPQDSVSDGAGNLYIADTLHNRIRKVTNGVITTIAGTGQAGFGGDGGPAASALLYNPAGLALDAAGNLFVSDTSNNVIRKIAGGVITTVVGTPTGGSFADNVAATGAALNLPKGIAMDSGGNLYIADSGTQRVRKVSNGQITTIAGIGGAAGYNGDGGQATAAALNNPSDVKLDASEIGRAHV